jgi:hypothetical protein
MRCVHPFISHAHDGDLGGAVMVWSQHGGHCAVLLLGGHGVTVVTLLPPPLLVLHSLMVVFVASVMAAIGDIADKGRPKG